MQFDSNGVWHIVSAKSNNAMLVAVIFLPSLSNYTANVLSAESTDKCLRTKSKDNEQ